MPKGVKDPYDFNPEAAMAEQEKKLTQRSFSGVYCPRRNDNQKCQICADVSRLWSLHNDTGQERSKYSEKARKYGASAHVYMNVVFPDEPSEVRILRCGIKMCQAIVNGMRYTGWGNVIHPAKGTTMIVHKTKGEGGFNTYNPSPDFQAGPRKLADMSVLERLHNLDDMDELRDQGVEEFNITTVGDNKTIKFDILPGWKEGVPQDFFKVIYYHYNVPPEAVEEGVKDPILRPVTDGGAPTEDFPVVEEDFSPDLRDTTTDAEWEHSTTETQNAPSASPDDTTPMQFTMENKPACFGKEFEEDDPTEGGCMDAACDNIREACRKATAKYRAKKG